MRSKSSGAFIGRVKKEAETGNWRPEKAVASNWWRVNGAEWRRFWMSSG